MTSMMSFAKRFGVLAVSGGLVLTTGCAGFFPPLTSSGSGSGATTTGDYVYVASALPGTVSGSTVYPITGFTIGTGTLTALSGATETLLVAPQAMVVTPLNSYLYVVASGAIYGYSISSTGALTQLLNTSGGQVLANANIVSMVVSPDGNWLLGLDSLQTLVTIDEFSIGTNGQLGVGTTSQYALKSQATIVASNIAVAPDGDYIAASVGTGGVVEFSFATSTGTVTPAQELDASTASTAYQAAVFDPTSSILYVAASGTSGGVYPFTIGTAGALTEVAGAPYTLGTGSTIAGPASMLIDKTGKYLYVGNRTAGSISGYSIATGGLLTPLSGSPYTAGTTVSALGYDNTGDYILASAYGGAPDLQLYSFDATIAGKLDTSATAATGDPTEPAGAVAIALTH